MKMNWNKDGDVTFADFIDTTVYQLSEVFQMFGWRWSMGNILTVPDATKIKNVLIDTITLAFESDDEFYVASRGRIGVILNKKVGELTVYLEMDSFFGEPSHVDTEVDLLFPSFGE